MDAVNIGFIKIKLELIYECTGEWHQNYIKLPLQISFRVNSHDDRNHDHENPPGHADDFRSQ